jgi:hypothetical protein
MLDLFREEYGEVLKMAEEGEQRCLNGKRWGGNAVLIVVDAALDSIGLNYFQIIVPRVRRFWKDYVKTGLIASLEDFSNLSPQDPRLRGIMNNERCWRVAISVCKVLGEVRRKEDLSSDFAALRAWAERANHEKWWDDPVGAISGVGLVTFQYLRMQAGVDCTMPDKIVRRVVERVFAIKAVNDLEFIKKLGSLSAEIGYSQTFICWAIWLKESDMKTSSWEGID